jgi:V/A-type H+-transporting ATPase subunit F
VEYFVIGEPELVTGFALVGVEGQVALNRQEALDAFNKMTGQSSAVNKLVSVDRPKILIVTEDVADMLEQEILNWQMKGASPLIVEIPGLQGHIAGRKTLTDAIREAVGIQV